MSSTPLRHRPSQPASILILRCSTATLLAIHGWYRLVTGGFVGFGAFLSSKGLPLGLQLAFSVTVFEIAASFCILLGRAVLPAALGHSIILLAGIAMVHARDGWFVVGGGRNGVEYSLLLLASLAAIVRAERESKAKQQ